MPGEGAVKVGPLDRLDFDGVSATLEGVASGIRSAVEKFKPRLVRVELGLDLAVKSGKLTGLVVEGQGAAAFKVTLEWGEDG